MQHVISPLRRGKTQAIIRGAGIVHLRCALVSIRVLRVVMRRSIAVVK
jgi:hypothetical protein